MNERRVVLAERRDERGTFTTDLELKSDGSVRVGQFDFGPMVDELRGGDHEHDVVIKAGELASLCFVLLAERFKDDLDAVAQLKELCAAHGIPIDEMSWN